MTWEKQKALEVAKDAWNTMKINDASIQVRYCSPREVWTVTLVVSIVG
jgi:hypothetical protein